MPMAMALQFSLAIAAMTAMIIGRARRRARGARPIAIMQFNAIEPMQPIAKFELLELRTSVFEAGSESVPDRISARARDIVEVG